MKVSRVFFPPRHMPEIRLEGEMMEGGAGGGRPCVVSHPHPLAGGTMRHPVVEGLWHAAAAAGLRALRYNFRGVGESTGELTAKSPLAIALQPIRVAERSAGLEQTEDGIANRLLLGTEIEIHARSRGVERAIVMHPEA